MRNSTFIYTTYSWSVNEGFVEICSSTDQCIVSTSDDSNLMGFMSMMDTRINEMFDYVQLTNSQIST